MKKSSARPGQKETKLISKALTNYFLQKGVGYLQFLHLHLSPSLFLFRPCVSVSLFLTLIPPIYLYSLSYSLSLYFSRDSLAPFLFLFLPVVALFFLILTNWGPGWLQRCAAHRGRTRMLLIMKKNISCAPSLFLSPFLSFLVQPRISSSKSFAYAYSVRCISSFFNLLLLGQLFSTRFKSVCNSPRLALVLEIQCILVQELPLEQVSRNRTLV